MEKDVEMTNEEVANQEEYESLAKDGYVHLINTKNDKKILFYIEKGMPLNVAFDGAFDLAVHLRELYKQQVNNALKEQDNNKDTDMSDEDSVNTDDNPENK